MTIASAPAAIRVMAPSFDMDGSGHKIARIHGMTGTRTRTLFPAADFRTTIAFATAFTFVVRTVP